MKEERRQIKKGVDESSEKSQKSIEAVYKNHDKEGKEDGQARVNDWMDC